ncbi:putative pentatricopeptide repeat-containing protein At3g16890, mitochondrial isoform X2 [Rosa chinensis]|uniref:putative pentatricopeptide repeat-containing protein At3g16890, mitochondrial isoform X2 n=1 Tax=Rosa chinensis TaxID=74649 RepID=UPI001AD8BCBB|nr:putative pentatricopeptide repeat-containing protein At3g16890, mitochondrial isoform X2 [Rosa chinensis]
MRWLSSLASRVSPALRTLPHKPSPSSKIKPSKPLPSAPHKGNYFELRNNLISAKNTNFRVANKPIDHLYIARILSRKDWFLLLDHELNARRIVLNPQAVASVLQNQENPLHPFKFSIWVSNIDPLFLKNQSVRSVLANTLFRKGPVVLSVELLKDINNSGLKVTEDLLCILIGSWGRLGLAKYCAEVFGQISFLGLGLSTRLYNAVIDALVKSNSLDLAYLKFQQMPADNCYPDRFTYNILIHGVCKIGIVDEALRLVKQMEGLGYLPNVRTYTILVDGFCNSRRVDEAFGVMKIMRDKNVTPNEATVRSLVHGVFRCMDPSKAFELLLSFVERESLLFKVACDTILYCLSINHMAREIAVFLKKSGAKGYLPDSSTFNVAMVCLTKESAHPRDDVHDIFESFIHRGGKPGFGSYLALIEAMYKSGNVDEGNQIFEQMTKDGLVSSVFSYNMVIDCFCKAQIMDMASKAFGDMQQKGIPPNLVTFNTLLTGYCKAGEVSKAHELLIMLLQHGFKPDIFTFSTIIDGLCRVHQIDDAFDCFAEMVRWGITPNVITYNILLRSLCFVGDIARGVRLMKSMQCFYQGIV